MTKIAYLRESAAQKHDSGDLAGAARIGEVLLREHWHNRNFHTRGYADDLFNLACAYDELGSLEKAAALYSDSAAQISVVEGERLPFARRLNNLATVLMRMEVYEPAYFMMGNVAAIRRKFLGANHTSYADSLFNLANAAVELGREEDAMRYHLQALQIRENAGHTDDIIISLHSVAFLYEKQKKYDEAIIYAEGALTHSVLCDETYAGACNYLAELFVGDGQFENALSFYDRALETITGAVGREHSSYLNVALRRANILTRLERHRESLFAHEEVREAFERISGKRHAFYANCLRGISMLHHTLGEPERAEAAILEATKIRRLLMEDITLDVAFLIRLYLSENETEKALDALVYALMCCPLGTKESADLVHVMTAAFNGNIEMKNEFIGLINLLNDREKLRPILQKWEAWEKSPLN